MTLGRPRAFDKDKALDRAMEVFWQKGYEGASLTGLTKAMGINPPSLYAAFGNKEGLFRAALDRYVEGHAEFLAEVINAPTAREMAERLLRGTADLLTDPCHPPGCVLIQGGLACGAGAETIPRELAARRARLEHGLAERLAKAKADGDLPNDADPAGLARYLTTVAQGMAIQASAGTGRHELRQIADIALGAIPASASG